MTNLIRTVQDASTVTLFQWAADLEDGTTSWEKETLTEVWTELFSRSTKAW